MQYPKNFLLLTRNMAMGGSEYKCKGVWVRYLRASNSNNLSFT